LLNLLVGFSFSQKLFTEVSDSIGLDYRYPGNDNQLAGGGLMVIDVNNDGWEDLYQSGGVFDSKLWLNENGLFRDATIEYKLDVLEGYFIQGAVSADYDNDGYEDFVVANFGKGFGQGDKHAPVILHNVKGDYFEPIYLDSILPAENYAAACWGDINNDGYVDIYLANYVKTMSGVQNDQGREVGYKPSCYENKLLINEEGKGFKEMSASYGIGDGGCGLAVSFTDIDNDHDLDLLLLNDFGEWTKKGNRCFINEYPDPTFTDMSMKYAFDQEMYGMGVGQSDYNSDGKLEYYITNIGENYFFSFENGRFVDLAGKEGIDNPYVYDCVAGTSWSGLFFDYEFDGDQDLYVSQGNVTTLVPPTAISDPNRLFIFDEGCFKDTTLTSGVSDVLSHRGAVIFDYDRDGDLDIISSVVKLPWAAYAGKEQKIKAFRNDVDAGNYVAIRLEGKGGFNRSAIGARVVFHHKGKKNVREVDGASGHASQGTKKLYFGLGSDKQLDKLEVIFGPNTMFVFENLTAGKTYSIDAEGNIEELY